MKNKIGLLGGTFNPVHHGHIELGQRVLNAFNLNKILYIISANPPHKNTVDLPPAPVRWEMLKRALTSFPNLVPCDVEMKRSNPSWTYRTINILKSQYSGQNFYFLSGSEGFLKIKTWKNYRKLLSSVFFIVILRKGGHKEKLETLLKEENVSFCYDQNSSPALPCIHFYSYESDKLQLSSTLIREKIQVCESVGKLVPKEVLKFMKENNLYGF
ncbi:MAG: nicotinate (nicotinamide) nucleotide adenylyltransferase [Candidatus Aminicenantes bacterium]|nr:nicotinate (nicotinamide) nucleotide adenylyltransferase [Candidatus Aminicenantes bacterium]